MAAGFKPTRRSGDLVIDCKALEVGYGQTRLFPAFDWTVRWGERWGVIGENGAGKSTIMKILYGFYTADEGEIWVDGERRNIRNPHDAIALGLGMVHQHFMLVPPMTVLEMYRMLY